MITFNQEQENFISDFVNALKENNAAVFAGAGLSVPAGFVNWKELLKPIAEQLGLDIDEEHDLIALAQDHVNEIGNRNSINQRVLDAFNKKAAITENHRILARLPISIYWTTNYDSCIEDALEAEYKTPDVKRRSDDFTLNLSKRDAVVYKMHGDKTNSTEVVITKDDYEDYDKIRSIFSNAFKNDLISRTFLFLGFGFSDPNIDYLINRIRIAVGQNIKTDYCIVKKEIDKKKIRKQELKAKQLKKYGIHTIYIKDYNEIQDILHAIEIRYRRNSVIVSGSAEQYGEFGEERAKKFIHNLSFALAKSDYKVVTGFGLGIGSAVINGTLDYIYSTESRYRNINDFLILRPFPQFPTGNRNLKDLWTDYRREFIPLAGAAVFVFGNKCNAEGKIITANGVQEEFEIAKIHGLKIIPVGCTGFVAESIWKKVTDNISDYYQNESAQALIKELGNKSLDDSKIIKIILDILKIINEKSNA